MSFAGLQVLRVVRENGCMRLSEILSTACAGDWRSIQGLEIELRATLDRLATEGLVELDEVLKDADSLVAGDELDVRLGSRFDSLYKALGGGLTRMAASLDPDALVIAPVFGRPKNQVPTDILVVMSFADEMLSVFTDGICEAAANLGLSCRRADEPSRDGAIIDQIWSDLNACRMVVAECTNSNPNVFYEVGIAHSIGKPVILLTQRPDEVPFDVAHLRYIGYSTDAEGLQRLIGDLQKMVEQIFRPAVD